MTTQVVDGYDHYNSVTDLLARSGFLQYQIPAGFQPSISFTTGLSGYGKALELGLNSLSDGPLREVFGASPRNAEAILGWRVYFQSEAGINFTFTDGTVGLTGTPQVAVKFNASNYCIQIYRGSVLGTLLYTSSNNVWFADAAQFIEIDCKIDPSAGSVTVKVDNVTVASISGVNTQSSANTWFDVVDLQITTLSGVTNLFIDDHYYNDTTTGPGTFPMNSFAGDSLVYSLFATGNDAVQFTPLANQNWQEISEVIMDSDVSYNFDNTAGHQDTFTFQPLLNFLNSIYAAQLTYATRNDGAGTRTIAGVIKIGGTSYVFGSAHSVPASASYVYFSDMWNISPATGVSFTRTEINAADYGYKLVT